MTRGSADFGHWSADREASTNFLLKELNRAKGSASPRSRSAVLVADDSATGDPEWKGVLQRSRRPSDSTADPTRITFEMRHGRTCGTFAHLHKRRPDQ